MENLVKHLKESEYAVAFTGAGVSTLSGIRDFRGKNGLYKLKDADRVFDIDWFRKNPALFYRTMSSFIYEFDDAKPSIVHTELARLEAAGIIKSVITQNVDLLHRKAGSKNVLELHGSIGIHRCLSCNAAAGYEYAVKAVKSGRIPECIICKGILKPDIVFFGETLPEGIIKKAKEQALKADLILVLGSTLLVQPAASIPLYGVENRAKLIIVNDMDTPYDSLAVLRYRDLGSVFDYLNKNLFIS